MVGVAGFLGVVRANYSGTLAYLPYCLGSCVHENYICIVDHPLAPLTRCLQRTSRLTSPSTSLQWQWSSASPIRFLSQQFSPRPTASDTFSVQTVWTPANALPKYLHLTRHTGVQKMSLPERESWHNPLTSGPVNRGLGAGRQETDGRWAQRTATATTCKRGRVGCRMQRF